MCGFFFGSMYICIVVFLYCFVYVYIHIFFLSVLV